MSSPSIHPSTSGDTSTHVATTIKDAPKPFDGSSFSDVVLRSDDSVHFFALRSLLCFVSPTFEDKFNSAAKEGVSIKRLPVVPVSEDSETLLCLLSLIYPHDREPQVGSAALFSKVCRAARKYSMDIIERKLRGMLRGVEPSHGPDTVVARHFMLYAIAVQFGWHAEATKAARHTISTPWRQMPYNDELRNISGADFYEYLAFRKGSKTLRQAKPLPPISTATKTNIRKPFIDAEKPFDSSAKADIILRSTNGVDFYVLRALLDLVAPAFPDASVTCLKNKLPVLNMEEDSTTLRHLLSFIYPQPVDNQIDDIDNFVKVCRAAQKYGMGIVGERLKHQLDVSRHIVDDPMRALWVATAFRWEKVAKKAAKNALALPLPSDRISLEDELWFVSGADVYWFIQYKLACCDAACEAVLQDRLFALDKSKEKERVFQRIIDSLKESPRGTSIKQTCISEIQETSNEPSDYQANFLFKLLKKRDKLVTIVENAISKVPLRVNCGCGQGA